MAAYLALPDFKLLSTLPPTFADQCEIDQPGYVDAQLEAESAWIDSRLRKRYAAPFVEVPYPLAVRRWLARIVTVAVWLKRGVDPSDEQWKVINDQADEARKEIAEAANSEVGLFDLPLRQDKPETGISKGFPRAYSESSPYVWTNQQYQRGTQEDESGHGSSY